MMTKLTVKGALAWSDKHRKLKGEGVRVVHIKGLLARQKKEMGEMLKLEPEIFYSKDQKEIYKAIHRLFK